MRHTPVYLVEFHAFGRPTPIWAMIVPAADAYDAMDKVRRRFGQDQTCSAVRFG